MKKLFFVILVLFCLGWAVSHSLNSTEILKDYHDIDSFIVNYRQPICGYKVKAIVKTDDNDINYADISFTKGGNSFTLHTSSFGDSIFNKGFWGVLGENTKIMNQYKKRT